MEMQKKNNFSFAFLSFIRTFGYTEGTLIQKSSNKFGFSFIYSYLCGEK